MNYHNILHDDMRNGDGLRTTLFISGCTHHCYNCQNPETWDKDSGILFDEEAKTEILDQLNYDYISGITLSGGDPLHESCVEELYELCSLIKKNYPEKTIWIYTGYTWEQIFESVVTDDMFSMIRFYQQELVRLCDVLVDGPFIENLADIKYYWAGSTNQRVINVQKSLAQHKVVLHCD